MGHYATIFVSGLFFNYVVDWLLIKRGVQTGYAHKGSLILSGGATLFWIWIDGAKFIG